MPKIHKATIHSPKNIQNPQNRRTITLEESILYKQALKPGTSKIFTYTDKTKQYLLSVNVKYNDFFFFSHILAC